MFSEADLSAVAKALAAAERAASGMPDAQTPQATERAAEPGVPNIYVSGVMDLGDGEWTVWANGYRITRQQQAPEFTVLGVKDNAVEIAVAGDQPARFRLHPYQTWRSGHHDVVEGIFP